MYLVKRSNQARGTVRLRDKGDGIMKLVPVEGVLFVEPPVDPEVDVRELSDAESKKHLAGLDEKAKKERTKGLTEIMEAAKAKLADFLGGRADYEATADAKQKELEAALDKAEADLDAADVAMGGAPKAAKPKGGKPTPPAQKPAETPKPEAKTAGAEPKAKDATKKGFMEKAADFLGGGADPKATAGEGDAKK